MQISAGPLTVTQLIDELGQIHRFFVEHKIDQVLVMFGWGCEFPIDELYKEIPVQIGNLLDFVKQNMNDGHYLLGDDDIYIRDHEKEYDFNLTHESDLALTSNNLEAINQFQKRWKDAGYTCYRKATEKNRWERIDDGTLCS